MTVRSRRLSVAVAVIAALAVIAGGCTRNAYAWDSFVMANNERASRGLPKLALDDVLVTKAQAWAEQMARSGRVSHSNLAQGAGTGWTVLGENVGWARSTGEMHSLFMSSPSHRSTLLSGRYNRVGVGVSVVSGRYYTVHVFAG